MNTSAKQAYAEMVKRVEEATVSKAVLVTRALHEQGVGVGNITGHEFVNEDGTWLSGNEAIKQSSLRFAIFNKNGEEKISLQSFFQLKAKADMLDFEEKEYTVKVLRK